MPTTPHVERAIAIAERELAESPTPEGLTQLARTYMLSRRYRESLEVIERGLALWPTHHHLLTIGAKAAKRCGDDARQQQYVERLAALAGVEAAFRPA